MALSFRNWNLLIYERVSVWSSLFMDGSCSVSCNNDILRLKQRRQKCLCCMSVLMSLTRNAWFLYVSHLHCSALTFLVFSPPRYCSFLPKNNMNSSKLASVDVFLVVTSFCLWRDHKTYLNMKIDLFTIYLRVRLIQDLIVILSTPLWFSLTFARFPSCDKITI